MEIELTLQEAKTMFPEQMKLLKEKKEQAKNKTSKETKFEDFKFAIRYGQMIQGLSLGEMIDSIGKEVKEKTIDEQMNEFSNSIVGLELIAQKRNVIFHEDLTEIPDIVLNERKERLIQQQIEKERFDNLSQDEKDNEINDIVKELSKYSGFNAFQIKI